MARILYADDDPELRENFASAIAGLGHSIVVVDDASLGWGLLKKGEQFDLIISDLNMPQMDGLTFLALVKKNPQTKKIPFALISGHHSTTLVDTCAQMGGHFFNKGTFSISELIKELLPEHAPNA